MIEDILKDLTSAILTLNKTLQQQARPSEPEPEKHEHKAPVAKDKTTAPTEPAAEPTPEAEATPTAQDLESRHRALQSLCLQIVRADPTKKARLKSILAEYNATIVSDLTETHMGEAERRIQDLG
jgi:hypothetical protein